ncbi:MAG: hypothetical protein EZS28_037647, partial [Streblomastix strix]
PKNYWLRQEFDKKDPVVIKLKGMSLKMNPQINKDAYENNIKKETIVKGKNTSLRQHIERNSDDEVFSKMSRINTTKNGITGVHTKMIVLENQCCCPSKSQAQILDELLKRFDKTKKQIDIAEDSMKLSIQTILKQPKRLNLTEFVDEIQIQDNDREIPVIIENADKIQYGGRTVQDCKSQEDIEKALQNLVQTQNVTHIRGDGEKGFASNQLMQFYNKNDIKTYFVNDTQELTNHNRVVDSVIRTIRNAFKQDDRDFSNPKLMQWMVDLYNDTPHGAFDNQFTPKQVNSQQELEAYFIKKNDKKLREVKQKQQEEGLTKYKPGNILMIHVDYLRTMHRYMKQRRNFNELAKFIKYDVHL